MSLRNCIHVNVFPLLLIYVGCVVVLISFKHHPFIVCFFIIFHVWYNYISFNPISIVFFC